MIKDGLCEECKYYNDPSDLWPCYICDDHSHYERLRKDEND